MKVTTSRSRGSSSSFLANPIGLTVVILMSFCINVLIHLSLSASSSDLSLALQQQQQASLLHDPIHCNTVSCPATEQKEGWHTIQVYFGKKDVLETQKFVTSTDAQQRNWYGQVSQDALVAALFSFDKNRYFVDLAANHPVYISNTFGLERNLQWKGLCIEANPQYWYDLSYRDCQVVAGVVGKTRAEQVQFNFNHELGGIVQSNFDNRVAKKDMAVTTYTVPILEILQRHAVPTVIDYLSLDVEGAEYFIMQDFPFDRHMIRVLTIERPKPELQTLLIRCGYLALGELGTFGETLWAHASARPSLDLTALAQFQVTPASQGKTFIKGAAYGEA